jgi:hypothetical protein
MAGDETVTVRRDDLELLQKVCACYAPHPPADDIREVMERTLIALREPPPAGPDPGPLPEGIFGRVELPGYRQHTGWITEETVFGLQMAVVRDWDGRVQAEVALGPGSQVVHLPTQLERPGPVAAIEAGDPDVWAGDDDDLDDEDGPAF